VELYDRKIWDAEVGGLLTPSQGNTHSQLTPHGTHSTQSTHINNQKPKTMFEKLFKPKKPVISQAMGRNETPQTETLEAQSKSKYPSVVDQIHNEFFTAGENLLEEAICLLKDLEQKDLAKGKRLAALGFGKTREAVAAIETETKLATTKYISDLVMHYQINYPNNKFIAESQVKSICQKYSLVCGDISMYKGFVPEVKLQMAEKFKLKNEDKSKLWFEISSSSGKELPITHISEKDLTEYGLKYFKRDSALEYSYIVGSMGDFGLDMFKQEICQMFSEFAFVKATIVSQSLKICAPLKDMEIPKGKEVVGYKIQDIPDPVVLQPVQGGYLIVCAWGDEASDEIVVNQGMN
jgi:hypothetical protein